ncbi:LpqB family beta-propeller domain-containing protein [Streptomyces sp. Ru87]|uniref:LpqB family beta-propeller domain-containing protein n=1 Tax=Streptomyces sp. Ru87 TaxID=2044307 RepID=UPI00211DA293|nr:LpqB family beta-propeller domain-containing protein [Streptomyces sp. Ru87]
MSSDRHIHRTGHRYRAAVRLCVPVLCGIVVLAGCASMPDSGEVRRVDASQPADPDSQVRVFPVPPRKGELPDDIVRGFLEATTSDEADFSTARQYLTEEASENWDPFSKTTVLEDGPVPRMEPVPGDVPGKGAVAVLSGRQRASVDQKQAYKPEDSSYQARVHLTKVRGEWRIDGPPDGLVLGQSDFERIYRSVNNYYFAYPGKGGSDTGTGGDVLVADPVYLRKRVDLVTSAVETLLRGPGDWLDPVAATKFPRGTKIVDESLSLDDVGGLRVRLNDRGSRVGPLQCNQMASQLLFTVQDIASAQVKQVELADAEGARLCVVTRADAAAYAPAGLKDQHPEQQYFIDAQGRMASLPPGGEEPVRVEGPFGAGGVPLRSIGVARDERTAAAVSQDARKLYVAPLEEGAELGESLLTSEAPRAEDGLTPPSWDGHGDLWIADRDPERSRLLRLEGGTGEPQEVVVPSLGKGRIKSLRVASDGVRIALVVQRNGHASLELGRIEQKADGTGEPRLSVNDLRSVTPQLEDVESASWAGDSRLVVVGQESGVRQLLYVQTDGSVANTPTLPGANGVTAVAASEDEDKPLLADSDDGIVRLPAGAGWQLVTKQGSAPVYPG